MGKAFVAKLAKQGARDPEALAAWIGRKKHGKAFGKLAAAGKKPGDKKGSKSSSKQRSEPKQAEAASKQAAGTPTRNAGGFTESEERMLAAASSQASTMSIRQLLMQRDSGRAGSTRRDELRVEAVARELNRRQAEARQRVTPALEAMRRLNANARRGSFSMNTAGEGVPTNKLRRMSEADIERNLDLGRDISEGIRSSSSALSNEEKTMLYDVMHALRAEQRRRRRSS